MSVVSFPDLPRGDNDEDTKAAIGLPAPDPALTSAQKAAVIIAALPETEAKELLTQLGPGHLKSFAKATAELRRVPSHTLEEVILEFLDTLKNRELALGPDVAKTVLARIMSEESAASLVGTIATGEQTVWSQLPACEDAALARFIAKEHPRTGCVVMSKLPAEKAAAVLDLLDPEIADRVISGLERLPDLKPDVLNIVQEVVQRELLATQGGGQKSEVFLGAVFDGLSDSKREPLMKNLEDNSPAFARAVKREMFLFDDIPNRVSAKDVPVLSRTISAEKLKVALAYAKQKNSPTVEFILGNMSRRLAEGLEEAMGEMDEIKPKVGDKATSEIVRSIKGLVEQGELKLIELD